MIFSSKETSAVIGSWIKDVYREDRSLGIVKSIDEQTNMMLVQFPKLGRDSWIVWLNHGHYKLINS
jgi:hypothetical protein